jgi:2,5-diketo-D-gluconate reductase A
VIKAIGVANFYPDRLVDLIDHNEVPPAVNQVETHPFFQRQDYQQLLGERGVQLESWGPFAEGRNNLFSDPTLSQIGAAHHKSVAQVVLRWLIQRQVAANPKSVRPERMAENLDVFDFQLTDEEMGRIAALDTGASLFFDHRDPQMSAGSATSAETDRPQKAAVAGCWRSSGRHATPARSTHRFAKESPICRSRAGSRISCLT